MMSSRRQISSSRPTSGWPPTSSWHLVLGPHQNHALRWLGITGLLALVGCSSAAAPKNLTAAQAAYDAAKAGQPAQLAPAQLDTANQALAAATAAFERGEEKPVVDDLVYIAERRTALAVSAANKEAATREAQAATKEYGSLQETRYETAEARLRDTNTKLEEEKRKAAAQAKADQDRMDAASKQGAAEVARVKAQLDAEKLAREKAEKRAAAAMASLAEIAKVKEEKRGVVITLSGAVLFATGQHTLLPIAEGKLAEVAKAVKDQGFKKIMVEGHTDSRGSPAENEALSLRRAQEVRKTLVAEGIPANKIEAEGHGSRRPVTDNNSPEGRANNRRVEIVVTPD